MTSEKNNKILFGDRAVKRNFTVTQISKFKKLEYNEDRSTQWDEVAGRICKITQKTAEKNAIKHSLFCKVLCLAAEIISNSSLIGLATTQLAIP